MFKEYRGKIKDNALIPQLTFSLMSGIIAYGYFFEPDLLPQDTMKLYDNFSHQNLNDKIWHMCNV
jgi:hypothetical protein